MIKLALRNWLVSTATNEELLIILAIAIVSFNVTLTYIVNFDVETLVALPILLKKA